MCGSKRTMGTDEARGWKKPGECWTGRCSKFHVVLETPDPGDAFACWRLLERNGYDVSWCPGPNRSQAGPCPLVESGRCKLVEDASVVVSSLNLQRSSSRRVVLALERHLPDVPVIVVANGSASEQWPELLAGRRTLRAPVTAESLLASVKEALAG